LERSSKTAASSASNEKCPHESHLFCSGATRTVYEENTIVWVTSPTDTTSDLNNVFYGFLSCSHLVVEVEHILFRQRHLGQLVAE
jgi:hypothetical protein